MTAPPTEYDALRSYVQERIFTGNASEWACLREPQRVELTYRALVDLKRHTEMTRVARKSTLADIKSECLDRGREARADYFAAEADYLDWHRRALRFTRAVERRISETKVLLKELNVSRGDEANRGERAAMWNAIRTLTAAIGQHREEILASNSASDVDRDLWEILDVVAIRRGDAMVTAADLLARNFR